MVMAQIPKPPLHIEVLAFSKLWATQFLAGLKEAFPNLNILVGKTPYSMTIKLANLDIILVMHCDNPAHNCILVSINGHIFPVNEGEMTGPYVSRMMELVKELVASYIHNLNWKLLQDLHSNLPPFSYLEIGKDRRGNYNLKFVSDSPAVDATATISGGRFDNRIPMMQSANPALSHLLRMLIPPESNDSYFYVEIFPTEAGYVAFYTYGSMHVISFSTLFGATTFAVKQEQWPKIKNFLKEKNRSLVVIMTTEPPFDGVIGEIEENGELGELVMGTKQIATIKIGDELHCVPVGRLNRLNEFYDMFYNL